MHPFLAWLYSFFPAPVTAGKRERLYGAAGAGIGVLCTEWISHLALGGPVPWFIAPMGASAVLLFAVPASPLAQPWSIIGGNTLAAVLGVSCSLLIADRGMAAALAVALAISVMFHLRCLHPPSGAVALTAVLGGPAITAMGYGFVLWPVAVNSLLLLAIALLFNNALFRRYPHPHADHRNPHHTADPLPGQRLGFTSADLDAVLEERGEVLDISKDDLEEVLLAAEARAHQRVTGNIRCADIMSRDISTVTPDAPADAAWTLLSWHRVTALPVVDSERRLAGIISLHDFFIDHGTGRMRPDPVITAAHRVADLMTTAVRTARPEQTIEELVALLSDSDLHHMPVLDADHTVIGMITQSDLVAALYRRTVVAG